MKIVLWIGNEAHQKALANKIHSVFPISGIVTETRLHKPKITITKLFEKLFEKIFLSHIGKAWVNMKSFYNVKYIDYPEIQLIDVRNINVQSVFDFTNKIKPDIIIVSGTSMIKKELLSVPTRIGILNLHTGLSPYIKGGPNCTNWCIATKQYHLIGNTVMWIDAGIDSGNIFTSEFTEFDGDENLSGIHVKAMEHAHSLYLRAIEKIIKGEISNINQNDLANGKTYYTKQWGLKEKINLIKNINEFQKNIKSGKIEKERLEIKTVKV